MTMTRRDFLSASAGFAAAPALGAARLARAIAARGRYCRDRRGCRRHCRGAAYPGRQPQGDRGRGGKPDRRPLPHRHRDLRRAVRSRRALAAQSRHQPDDQARAAAPGSTFPRRRCGQKIRVGRRNARAGETEEFLAALVRANRAIDEASRGKADVSCASALPKDLGDWAGDGGIRARRQCHRQGPERRLRDRQGPCRRSQCRDRLPPGAGHPDRKTRRAGARLRCRRRQAASPGAAAMSRWRRRPARSPPAPPSSRCPAMCWRRAISNSRPTSPSASSMPRRN